MEFKDIAPSYSVSGYSSTNEEPAIHRRLLRRITAPARVASIASGGEVPLFVFLPKGVEVVAIDHSYDSIAMTFAKAELLRKLGAVKFRRLFDIEPYTEAKKLLDAMLDGIPEPLRWKLQTYTMGMHDEFRRELFFTPPAIVQECRRNLDKLTLAHGDLGDLAGMGKFGGLYISNALEHSGRMGQPQLNELSKGLIEGGVLFSTRSVNTYSSNNKPNPTSWALLHSIKGYRTTWLHELHQKVKAKRVKKLTVGG